MKHTKPEKKPQRLLTDAEQSALLALPAHTPAEVQSYLKPGEGFERVAPEALTLLAKRPEIAAALKFDLAHLREMLVDAAHLAALESATYQLHRRAMENRLERESDVYRALLKVNRFVQNSEDAELQQAFANLSAWVTDTHSASTSAGAPSSAAEPAPSKSEKSGA